MACVFASKLIVSRAEPDTRSLRGASPLSRRASAPKASAAAGFSRLHLWFCFSCPLPFHPFPFSESPGSGFARPASLLSV